jgi:hypothetical protein
MARMKNPSDGGLRSFSLEAPADFIEHLSALNVEGLMTGIPVSATSSVDFADSPMSRRKIASAIQIITALLGTATAGVKLADEVETYLHNHPASVIVLRDAQHGGLIGRFDGTSSREEIDKHLKI